MRSIPHTIHYCWFGRNAKSELIKRCIASWSKFMPDYEIKEWTEDNFKFDNDYVKEAYSVQKYAFVSDYARLKIIYEYGGIYLDTDVELIRSLSPLLEEQFGFIGFEHKNIVATGLGFAAPPRSNVIKEMLDAYNGIHFINNGTIDNTPCPFRNTETLIKLGLKPNNTKQKIGDIIVYPMEYLCPMDYNSGQTKISDNTFSIHHYNYSWADEAAIRIQRRKRLIFKYSPRFCAQFIFNVINHFYILFKKQ